MTLVRLAPRDGEPLPAPLPGQCAHAAAAAASARGRSLRSYSLSAAGRRRRYRISVKREPRRRQRAPARRASRPATCSRSARRAGPSRSTPTATPRRSCSLSAGVGVDAGAGHARDWPAPGRDREVWWLHGARNGAEHAFAGGGARAGRDGCPARALASCRSSRPDDVRAATTTRGAAWRRDVAGRPGRPRDADYYLCGPQGFMHEVVRGPAAAGRGTRAPAHARSFGPERPASVRERQPHAPPGASRATGRSSRSRARASRSRGTDALRQPARAARRRATCRPTGRAGPASATAARSGSSTARCATDPEPLDPPADGDVLVCCSAPKRAVVLDL